MMTPPPLQSIYRLLPRSWRAMWEPRPTWDESALRLAQILGLPPEHLKEVRLGPRYHYRPFVIRKRDGRERRLLAPSPALKTLQRKLLHGYLALLRVHPAATAFSSGASIVANARHHAGQSWIATLDIADFFESTAADRVRMFFIKEGWRGEALSTLMRLCVYRNSLPQSAPTSPCLSNRVNCELDMTLSKLAQSAGAHYTRYGDDLTFSWEHAAPPLGFEGKVMAHLLEAGYTVQPRKGWQVRRITDSPKVTGLILKPNGTLRTPFHVYRRLWHLRCRWWWTRDTHVQAQRRGVEGFIKMLRQDR
jgi:RNA-directed DNA polymerase